MGNLSKILLIVVGFGLLSVITGCGGGSQVRQDSALVTKAEIQGLLFVNPIDDLTAGRAMAAADSKEILNGILTRIKTGGKYSLTDDKSKATYVLNLKMIEFTAGNRALRLWVGFGAGSAKLHFSAQILDSSGKVIDEQNFQRFGAASLRSGPAIISQMNGLTIDYVTHWLRL